MRFEGVHEQMCRNSSHLTGNEGMIQHFAIPGHMSRTALDRRMPLRSWLDLPQHVPRPPLGTDDVRPCSEGLLPDFGRAMHLSTATASRARRVSPWLVIVATFSHKLGIQPKGTETIHDVLLSTRGSRVDVRAQSSGVKAPLSACASACKTMKQE